MSVGETVSKLEKDMLLAFKEQEDLSVAHSSNSVHSQYLSPESAQCEISQELDQSGTRGAGSEELGYTTPFRSRPQEETEGRAIPLEQQPPEKVIDGVGDVEDSSSQSEHKE
jgi:hypothetical protein